MACHLHEFILIDLKPSNVQVEKILLGQPASEFMRTILSFFSQQVQGSSASKMAHLQTVQVSLRKRKMSLGRKKS